MARMYSRRKGKAGSTRPYRENPPTWIRYKKKELEMLIVKLAKQEKTPSEIGLILRDSYGIPNVKKVIGKKITELLEEKDLLSKLPEDLLALIKKSVRLRKHIEDNHKDEAAKRGLSLTESKIKRLVKYYKKTGKVAEDWKYDPDKVNIYVD